ncbi:hypothetical protein CFC35_41970 [Streptomyces sp. FBKL.4005]|uniref:hypothetical protein n=1 Tax=Streptomyces sp. FBKL.4005 TaxID=2015515 RepID=UPI000B96F3FA|nr:hypothetical protein [Streptomyces sp. FBKL.4005]OYP09986.1 hypothetical protein CFC35_41970 [Streptomyces sp. FBKL.4005]
MVDQDDGSPSVLERAQDASATSGQALWYQEIAANLRSRKGLHYASINPDDRNGPHLVVYNGEIVGQTHTTSPGVLHDWYATPIDGRPERGPYVSARAAAAHLIPGRPEHGHGAQTRRRSDVRNQA